MGDRALAHIEKIVKTYPIFGADNIEMVQVLDFHVVTKKGEFKTDDTVVYIEVDSILPDGLSDDLTASYDILKKELKKATGERIQEIEREMSEIISKNTRPEFEFLRQKRFRVLARKYNFDNGYGSKTISQGIVFPTSILPEGFVDFSEGTDVTQILGITKIVEDAEDIDKTEQEVEDTRGKIETFLDSRLLKYKFYRKFKKRLKGEKLKGSWDNWFPSASDETNVQNLWTKFVEKNGRTGYYASLKLEGMNYSIYNRYSFSVFGFVKKLNFGVCSHYRNLITDDGSTFWNAAKRLDLQKKLSKVNSEIVVRGELMGPKICGNIYGLTEYMFFVFEVYDPKEKRLYTFDEMLSFCQMYGFSVVPIIDYDYTLPETVHEVLEYSNRKDELVPGKLVQSEGIIIRHKNNMKISTKAKSPVYLAKK